MPFISSKDLENTTDVNGFKMPIKRFNGFDHTFWSNLPNNIEEHLSGISESVVRSDDVFICTYPRSGTNWTNEIVNMLVNHRTSYVSPDHFLEWFDNMSKKEISELPSPRVFVSHLPFQFLPSQLTTKGRVICVFRNPKDVAVSFYNWTRDITFADFDGSFDDYLKLFYNGDVPSGSWFEHVKGWEKVIQNKTVNSLLQIYYEDLNKVTLYKVGKSEDMNDYESNDLRSGVESIAKFLGVKTDEGLLSGIVEKCSFNNMVKEKKSNVPDIISYQSKDKGNYLYRRGKIGDWKNWFTVAQSEQFDLVYKEEMKDSIFSFTYSV